MRLVIFLNNKVEVGQCVFCVSISILFIVDLGFMKYNGWHLFSLNGWLYVWFGSLFLIVLSRLLHDFLDVLW